MAINKKTEIKANDIRDFEKKHKISLPRDVSSETGIIATILNHPEYILKTNYLKARFFAERELGLIYHVVENLFTKGVTSIDSFIVLNEIEGNKDLKTIFENSSNIHDVGEYLEDLRLVARNNLNEYEILAKKVMDMSFKRETYIKLTEMSNSLLNSNMGINELNRTIQTDIVSFSDNYIIDTNVKIVGDSIDEIFDEILKDKEHGVAGFPSKFAGLSEYFTYLKNEMCLYIARAKGGKSMLFLNEAIHLAENGVPVAIFDTEMKTKSWVIRFLALKSGVEIKKIMNGGTTKEEDVLIFNAKNWLKEKPIVHMYDPDWTKDKIYMVAKQLKLNMNLQVLIFDYIKMMSASNMEIAEHNILGDLCNFLKNDIACGLDLAVIAGAQASPGKELRASDSDKLNRYASTVVGWQYKTVEEKVADGIKEGNQKVTILYNRNGEQFNSGEYLNFIFDGSRARISQAEVFKHECEDVPY